MILNKTWRSSFSAVSTPIFASKYSLESSRRDLHNALLCTVLQSQNFSQKSSSFFRDWITEFANFFICFVKFCIFSANFWWFFPGFRAKFQKRVSSVTFQSILRKQIRKLPKTLKSVKIIQYYSEWHVILLFKCPRERFPRRNRSVKLASRQLRTDCRKILQICGSTC